MRAVRPASRGLMVHPLHRHLPSKQLPRYPLLHASIILKSIFILYKQLTSRGHFVNCYAYTAIGQGSLIMPQPASDWLLDPGAVPPKLTVVFASVRACPPPSRPNTHSCLILDKAIVSLGVTSNLALILPPLIQVSRCPDCCHLRHLVRISLVSPLCQSRVEQWGLTQVYWYAKDCC